MPALHRKALIVLRPLAAPRRLALLLSLCCLPLGVSAGGAGPGPRRPNIILLSIDNLRADHLGCYGYARDTSPNLDALSREAALFENHVSPSAWTLPVHMSLFTSMYPSFHGLTRHPVRWSPARWLGTLWDWLWVTWRRLWRQPVRYRAAVRLDRLRPGLRTLAEALRASGYRTGALAASANLGARWGLARGFDWFVDNPERTPASEQNAAALRWLDARSDAPFFLFLHYYDLHRAHTPETGMSAEDLPYDCPGPARDRFLSGFPPGFRPPLAVMNAPGGRNLSARERAWVVGLYDGCIRRVDSDLGAFLAELRRKGLYDDTLLIVTSDHGEEFWEHESSWGHGLSLRQELVHAPLWLKEPGPARGRRIKALTSGLDLMPSIVAAAQASSRELQEQMQGLSLAPLLKGGSLSRAAVFSERDFRTSDRAVFTPDGWKLLLELDPRRALLFDLRHDPGEDRDLGRERPEKQAELEELLDEFYSGPLER